MNFVSIIMDQNRNLLPDSYTLGVERDHGIEKIVLGTLQKWDDVDLFESTVSLHLKADNGYLYNLVCTEKFSQDGLVYFFFPINREMTCRSGRVKIEFAFNNPQVPFEFTSRSVDLMIAKPLTDTSEVESDYPGMLSDVLSAVQESTINVLNTQKDISELRNSLAGISDATNIVTEMADNIQAFLGYDDEQILGLEADFENNTFTRLAGAKGMNAGEDFNIFTMYGGRRRCNVSDDGAITAFYGDEDKPKSVLLSDFQEVEFTSGAAFPPWEDPETSDWEATEDNCGNAQLLFTNDFYPTDLGNRIKIHLSNVTTGESHVFESVLRVDDGTNNLFGTFETSDKGSCSLTGWTIYDPTYTDSESGVQLFVYPFTTDKLKVKVELERSIGYKDDGTNGQVMVYQPKFYYRVVPTKLEPIEDGFGYHIKKANYYISEKARMGFKLHPAFCDENGNAVDYILYSAYEGNVSGGKLCSVAGVKPTASKTRTEFESLAKSRGDGWHIETLQAVSVNQLLFAIEYATFNSRDAIGRGVVSIADNGTDNCASITGSTATLGNGTGMATETISDIGGVRTTHTENGKVAVSYRGVENLWGNIYTHVSNANVWGDGTMQSGQFYITEGFDFNEYKHGGDYIPAGFIMENASYRFISAFGYGNELFDWMFAPSSCEGTSLLPVGSNKIAGDDINWCSAAAYGGRWDTGLGAGLFMTRTYDVGYGMKDLAARLIFIPTAK